MATGEQPLEHEDQAALCKGVLRKASLLHKYLPVLLGIGRSAVMPDVTGDEMKQLAGVLKKANDMRQGQLVKNYDKFYILIKELVEK